MDAATLSAQATSLRDAMQGAVVEGCPEELIELVSALERLKSAACAAQASASVTYDAARRAAHAAAGVPAARQGRGVAAEIALARQESPARGQVLLGLAKVLAGEMPHTLARLRDGSLSEFRATLLARETACLELPHRAFVDEEVAADPAALTGVGTRALVGRVKRMVAELDPAAVARRQRRAEAERCVSLRPAPDTMTYLTALLPVAQGVAALAALTRTADAARSAGDPRGRGQLMADRLVAAVTGLPDTGTPGHAPAVPVTLDILVPAETLAGGHQPAMVGGEVLPAEVARLLAARAIDTGVGAWFRQLYRGPLGRLVALTSRQRTFPDGLADLLALQGQGICATPWCDAPVRHLDHVVPVDESGTTCLTNGQGLCEACNHAKQAPDWQQRLTARSGERPQVVTVTPTGHRYTATAPAPPGWREPRFAQVAPGRYVLTA